MRKERPIWSLFFCFVSSFLSFYKSYTKKTPKISFRGYTYQEANSSFSSPYISPATCKHSLRNRFSTSSAAVLTAIVTPEIFLSFFRCIFIRRRISSYSKQFIVCVISTSKLRIVCINERRIHCTDIM